MTQIYNTEKHYTVEQFNRIRMSINYDGEVICKYDMTKDAVKMLVEDLVEFMVEDKLIKRKEQNEVKAQVKASVTMFAEVQNAKLAEEKKDMLAKIDAADAAEDYVVKFCA